MFLGETLAHRQIVGIVLVTLGALLLNGLPSFRNNEKKGAWLMGMASVFWGSMAAVDKICLRSIHPSMHAAIQTFGIAVIATGILVWRKEMGSVFRSASSQGFNLVLGTVGSAAAILLQLHVIQSVAVGLFEAIKRVFAMTFSVAWGRILYREGITRQKVFSMALMALGLVLLLVSGPARADKWDASLDAGLRTYPSGAALGLEGGRGSLLWGSEGGWSYGYTRLGARVQTSGVVNRVDAKISVFPISFWGLELKSGVGHRRLSKISTLDCATAECGGRVDRHSLISPFYFGAGDFFGRARGELQWISASRLGRPLADESTNLTVNASGDKLRKWDLLLGWRWRPDWNTLIFWEETKALERGSWNKSYGAVVKKSWGPQAVYLGAGIYESTSSEPSPQVFASYVLTLSEGYGF